MPARSALALGLALLAAAPAHAQLKVTSDAPAAPAGVQRMAMHSGTTGLDYVVTITAPPTEVLGVRATRPASQKLPAIYALDGGYGIAGPLAQMMASEGLMASAYIVAIGYPEGDSTSRNTDYLYRPRAEPTGDIGGGGARFETFLTKELRPYLEKRYPLDPSRAILFGHSFGGLFAANVLASDPAPWSGYIIASPSTPSDLDVFVDLPKAAAASKGKRAFVAVGGKELAQMTAGAAKVASILKTAGLVVESRTFENEGHISYYPALVPAAFAWILPPESAR